MRELVDDSFYELIKTYKRCIIDYYEWTTDWSDYFDDGHEWWGAACWSVYDRSLKRYVVIMASTTD